MHRPLSYLQLRLLRLRVILLLMNAPADLVLILVQIFALFACNNTISLGGALLALQSLFLLLKPYRLTLVKATVGYPSSDSLLLVGLAFGNSWGCFLCKQGTSQCDCD